MASTIILSDNGASSGSAGLKSSGGNDGVLILQTTTSGGTATNAVYVNNSQNVGLSTTPSAWEQPYWKGIEIGRQTALMDVNQGGNYVSVMANNMYWNGTNWVFKNDGFANMYLQNTVYGNHVMYGSSTGTAGSNASGSLANMFDISKGKTLALQGGSSTTGTGIAFPGTQSASTDANTLDDYEEGTFTCTIGYSTNITTATSANATTTATGTYIKIGKMVQVSFPFLERSTTFGGSSVIIFYMTVPFTCGSAQGFGAVAGCYNISARYTGTSFTSWINYIAVGASTNQCSLGSTTYNNNGGGYISFENASSNLLIGCTYIASA